MRVSTRSHIARRLVATLLVLVSTLALAACAAPADRSAAVKGTRLCITNSTSYSVMIYWRHGDGDPLTNDRLAPTKSTCGTGYSSSLIMNDVTATVVWMDRRSKDFTAWNQFVGLPQVRVDSDEESAAEACGLEMIGPMDSDIGISVPCSDGYHVGDRRAYFEKDYHESIVTRKDDTENWKEFTLDLRT